MAITNTSNSDIQVGLKGLYDLNKVTIQRNRTVFIPEDVVGFKSESNSAKDIASIFNDLTGSGIMPTGELIGALLNCGEPKVASDIISAYRSLNGGDYSYEPMYKDFAEVVPNMDPTEYLIDQLTHYVGSYVFGVSWKPEMAESVRKELRLPKGFKGEELSVASELSYIKDLVVSIIGSGQPFKEMDKEHLGTLVGALGGDLDKIFGENYPKVPVKENLIWLIKEYGHINSLGVSKASGLMEQIGTIPDVLRLAVGFSNGDVSLSNNTKFKLSRPQRKVLLSKLNDILSGSANESDFMLHEEHWKRLASYIHAGDYYSVGDPVVDSFNKLYGGDILSYAGRLDMMMAEKDLDGLLKSLSNTPGIFARRLHHVLRTFPGREGDVIESFSKVAPKVSLNVLVQLHNLFSGPNSNEMANRALFTKKSSSVRLTPNRVEPALTGTYKEVVKAIEHGMKGRLSEETFIKGKNLKNFMVPLNVRSASSGSAFYGRGSRLNVPSDMEWVRFFTHWKNIDKDSGDYYGYGAVDLDMSVSLLSEDFTNNFTMGYYNASHKKKNWIYSSGDITSAPGEDGAAEFLDIHTPSALNKGYRYAVMYVNSYSRQMFSDIPDANVGVMVRTDSTSGENFDPKTVVAAFDLNSDSTAMTPVIIDMKKMEIIWTDIQSSSRLSLLSDKDLVQALAESVIKNPGMSVKRFLKLTGVNLVNKKDVEGLESSGSSTLVETINGESTDLVLNLLGKG